MSRQPKAQHSRAMGLGGDWSLVSFRLRLLWWPHAVCVYCLGVLWHATLSLFSLLSPAAVPMALPERSDDYEVLDEYDVVVESFGGVGQLARQVEPLPASYDLTGQVELLVWLAVLGYQL